MTCVDVDVALARWAAMDVTSRSQPTAQERGYSCERLARSCGRVDGTDVGGATSSSAQLLQGFYGKTSMCPSMKVHGLSLAAARYTVAHYAEAATFSAL